MARAEVCASCVKPNIHCASSIWMLGFAVGGAGAAAGCGSAGGADLFEPTEETTTTAAGVLEVEEAQKEMKQELLCAEGSRWLRSGSWCGRRRTSSVAVRACGRQLRAGERVSRGATRARSVEAHEHMWRLLLWRP